MATPWTSEEEREEYFAKQKEERKMTCKDCVYYAMCYKIEHYGNDEGKPCEMFRNKADYAEVKHGEWIISGLLKRAAKNEFVFTCSVCGFDSICDSDYCRNCGADMRERRDGND